MPKDCSNGFGSRLKRFSLFTFRSVWSGAFFWRGFGGGARGCASVELAGAAVLKSLSEEVVFSRVVFSRVVFSRVVSPRVTSSRVVSSTVVSSLSG